MAASLIDTMTEDFDPDQYHDTYREALEAVVRAKIEGNDIVRPEGAELTEPNAQPADLTEILRASVAAVKSDRAKPAEPAAKPAKPAKAKAARPRARASSKKASPDGASQDDASQDAASQDGAAKPRTRRKASA
jgi:DNA end-binding protein Ku